MSAEHQSPKHVDRLGHEHQQRADDAAEFVDLAPSGVARIAVAITVEMESGDTRTMTLHHVDVSPSHDHPTDRALLHCQPPPRPERSTAEALTRYQPDQPCEVDLRLRGRLVPDENGIEYTVQQNDPEP